MSRDAHKTSESPKRAVCSSLDRKKPFSRFSSRSKRDIASASEYTSPPRASATATTTSRMNSPPSPTETSALLRQNQELRQRLQNEANNYRRRIDTYKQAQQNQVALVSRLQAKILQYKQRCSDLEEKMHETIKPSTKVLGSSPCSNNMSPLPPPPPTSHVLPCSSTMDPPTPPLPCRDLLHHDDHDELYRCLEEEKKRCEQLMEQNTALRQQLEDSNRTNEALTNDLQKLHNDWDNLRDELLAKEDEFKEEEQAFNDYYHSEHNRLLKMWHELVSVKRTFREMQTTTKSDLGRMRLEVYSANREANSACNSVLLHLKQTDRMAEQQKLNAERENNELKAQLTALRVQNDNACHEINQRDIRLQELMQQLKTLEGRCTQAENQALQANILADEIEKLNSAFRDIAHAVVQDAEIETSGDDEDTKDVSKHLHLSQMGKSPAKPKSPRKQRDSSTTRTSQAIAEGTVSAVQAALNKYQLAFHDLKIKLQSNSDIIQNTRKQLDASEHAKEILTSKVAQLTEKLEESNLQLSELTKERDSLQKILDSIRNEKQNIEKGRAELNIAVDNLSSDYEKLQIENGKLQKHIDALEEEKKALEFDYRRIMKDKDIIEMNLRAEVDHGSKMHEEIITLREEINKLYLSKDLLEQQRLESENLISTLEKQKADLEFDLDKILMEKNDLHTRLDKLLTCNDGVSEEVKRLKDILTESESERVKLKCQNTDQSNDISSLKKELIAAEQTRLELETEKSHLNEKIKCLEMKKEKIEQELTCVVRDKGDLHNQLTCINRKKESLNEELMRTQQRLEQANETNNRLNRNLEELIKENEERQVVIESHEKELQRLQELLASLRSEKESLEAVLFDTNTSLEATEEKRNQLEREVQDLLIKEENLRNQVARLTKDLETCNRRAQETKTQLINASRAQEAELMQKIEFLKMKNDETVKKLNEEKETLKVSLEKRMQQALHSLRHAKDEEINKLQEALQALHAQLEDLCHQHEETLIRAENEKQQALLMVHRDKKAISEKLDTITRQLKTEMENFERNRREAAAKAEKDRNLIAQLRDELVHTKMKGEEIKTHLEEEISKLEIQIGAMREERDNASRLVDEFKIELRLKEDKIDSLNNQLQDTLRKLNEAENSNDAIRKDLTDTRRMLADCNVEKDKYMNSNRELREHIKLVESSKRDQSRTVEEALQKIASLEDIKNALENEKTRLATLLKEAENDNAKLTQELNFTKNNLQKMQIDSSQKDASEKELQARLNNETEEKEHCQQELNQLKKQMADLEGNLCTIRQELGRARCHANQEEHRWHNREQELCSRIEEFRGREKRLEDQKHNLEVCLADATQQIQELKARLGGAEGRIRALDEQLAATEAYKKDAENKLSSIAHTLRRIAGIQFDGSVNASYRLMSPSRRYSPVRSNCGHDYEGRSVSGCQDGPVDVDPELIRKGVRTLMNQVAQIEREKYDYKSQLCVAKKQLQDAADQQMKCDSKVSKLQQTIRHLQDEKSNLEAQLNVKIIALKSTEETLKQKSEEIVALMEKLNNLEMRLTTEIEEKGQAEELYEKCRQHCSRLEQEKNQLKEEIARIENRASKLDLQRVALEGDINRLQMAISENDTTIRALQERLENQSRNSAQLEDRCMSLKTTVDQLKDRLQKAALIETELRGEINVLHKERSEQGHCIQANQDKLKQLQKTLSAVENEKRIFQERLDAAQNTINELRRGQQAQQDTAQRLQEQVAELEVQKSSLESQLRILKWNRENMDQSGDKNDNELSRQLMNAEREKSELQRKLDQLKDKVKQLENERQRKYASGSGNRNNLYDIDSNRLETDYRKELSASSSPYNCGLDHSKIEQENRDLRMKVRRLETLLAEKEAELAKAKACLLDASKNLRSDSTDRYHSSHLDTEKLLDAKEQAHRHQINRLENQISMLREQLAQEAKRRQQYILRSSRANREMQHLRNTLGDSLRHVSQDPLDPTLLESETRRLDTAVSMSLPPSSYHDYKQRSSVSPRK